MEIKYVKFQNYTFMKIKIYFKKIIKKMLQASAF